MKKLKIYRNNLGSHKQGEKINKGNANGVEMDNMVR